MNKLLMYLTLLKKKYVSKRGQVASAPPPTVAAYGPSEGRGWIQVDSCHQPEEKSTGFQEGRGSREGASKNRWLPAAYL